MVVRVETGLGLLLSQLLGQLGSEAELVDLVLEGMLDGALPVVLQVVDVHIPVAEAAAGGEVEVSDHLVHADGTGDAATLVPLLIELLGVVFALALLDALALTEGPGGRRVRLAHLVAGVAAAGLLGVLRGGGAVALAAVGGVEVDSVFFCIVTLLYASPSGSIGFASVVRGVQGCSGVFRG